MANSLPPVVLHVGYPKTGTTTFQINVFPNHPEIDYLGKFLPSHHFQDETLSRGVDALLHRPSWREPELGFLKQGVQDIQRGSKGKVILLSSEAFIHPIATDLTAVAQRLRDVFGPCKVWITIREQVSLLLSFYWMHGRHGQYLSTNAIPQNITLKYPLGLTEWLELQRHAYDRNLLPVLHYDEVISLYRDTFGASNVSVLVFEELRDDPAEYCEKVSSLLGVDAQETKRLAVGKIENASAGRSIPWHGREKALHPSRAQSLLRAMGRRLGMVGQTRDPEAILEELRQEFRPGNDAIVRELALPLARYGYAVTEAPCPQSGDNT